MLSPALIVALVGFVAYFVLDNISEETSHVSGEFLKKNLAG